MASPSGVSTLWANRIATNYTWAALLLKNIGAPVTTNNIQNVVRWQAAENSPKNWYNRNNPLNASLGTNSNNGTGTYSDLTTAAQNTAVMIVQGYKGGAIGDQIYNALQSNANPQAFSQAVVDSNWSSAHYGVLAAGAPAAAAVPGRLPDYISTIPLPATIPASPNVSGSGSPQGFSVAQQASGGSTTSKAVTCSSKPPIINSFGSSITGLKLTACQGKAMLGGFCVVAGGLVMLLGALQLAKNTAPVQNVLDKVSAVA